MDLFSLLLFIGCLLGAAAFLREAHYHGTPRLLAILGAVLMIAATGSVALFGGTLPHWVLMIAKVMVAIGFGSLGGYVAHHYQERRLIAFLALVVGLLLASAVVAYTPGIGFGSPFAGGSPTRPSVAPGSPAVSAPAASVVRPPPSSSSVAPPPKRIKIGKVPDEETPCYLLPDGCKSAK